MKIPTMLLYRVLLNMGLQVSVAVERDYREICSRFEHEGMSYLTITLPILCDALDQGLASGRLTRPAGFRACSKRGNLPALMAGFFRRVFNEDGSLLSEPCIDSVRAIRQVTRLFKKVELPCSKDRISAAYERYVNNDESLSNLDQFPVCISRIAGYLWSDLDVLAERLYCSPGIFGGGATAERSLFNGRHHIRSWPERAEIYFPASYHTAHDERNVDSFAGIDFHPPERELPVRVVQVPKTLKTPRTISVEPSYMMLMQQSIAKPLMDYLESNQFGMYSIRFVDQTVNRDMARAGSVRGDLATIDLSDASDLVSDDLVRNIFGRSSPLFLDMIEACRSRVARLPDGSVRTLNKFASMGSAMCFPIEAMVFYTIVMSAMVDLSGKQPSKALLKRLSARVSVYGDDIIVPTETASLVMERLEACGLRVNRDKSFYTGLFRESCGGDYYAGHDITPSYVRQWDFKGNSVRPEYVAACVSLSNQFYMKGLWHASQYIRNDVDRRWKRPLSRSRNPLGILTYASYLFDTGLKWQPERCGYRQFGPLLQVQRVDDVIETLEAGMLRSFMGKDLRDRRAVLKGEFTHSLLGKHAGHVESHSRDWDPDGRERFLAAHDTWDPSTGAHPDWDLKRIKQSSILEGGLYTHEDLGSSYLTSVRPYALSMKRKWHPTKVGIVW